MTNSLFVKSQIYDSESQCQSEIVNL